MSKFILIHGEDEAELVNTDSLHRIYILNDNSDLHVWFERKNGFIVMEYHRTREDVITRFEHIRGMLEC